MKENEIREHGRRLMIERFVYRYRGWNLEEQGHGYKDQDTQFAYNQYIKGFADGSESSQQQIDQMKAENEQLSTELDSAISTRDKFGRDIDDLEQQVDKLVKKENLLDLEWPRK